MTNEITGKTPTFHKKLDQPGRDQQLASRVNAKLRELSAAIVDAEEEGLVVEINKAKLNDLLIDADLGTGGVFTIHRPS